MFDEQVQAEQTKRQAGRTSRKCVVQFSVEKHHARRPELGSTKYHVGRKQTHTNDITKGS